MYRSEEDPADSGPSMEQLLEQASSVQTLQRGDTVEGIVMQVDHEGVLVHIGGYKAEGLIPTREMRSLSPDEVDEIEVGSTLVCWVVRPETEDSPSILSLDKSREESAWRSLEEHLESGTHLEATIAGANRGGALVHLSGVQGFVPLSQLVLGGRSENSENEDDSPVGRRVGETVRLKVLEVDRRRRRVILSERAALQEWKQEQKDRLMQELREGEVRTGKVSGIASFGAFVDLGGADGLIHISELAWGSVKSPEEVVQVGDEVRVQVLKVDPEQKRIALSLRRLMPEPWTTVAERYTTGQLVTGTVTKLTNFGAFARIEDGIEGLIHVSELSNRMVNHPRERVHEGDMVTVKIVSIEPERKRLGLSLKQAEEELDP